MVAGDVLTGADVANWTLANGLVRVTKTALVPNPIEGGLTMERWDETSESWRDAWGPTYGDWTFFASPFQWLPTSVTALAVDGEAIEVMIEWEDHPLDTGYLPLDGVLDRDWEGAANYDNGAQFKIIDTVTFRKTIKLVRGREGYFVGYHSIPNISPKNGLAGNNEPGYGEREAGTGGSNAVFFASSGFVARHPEWGSDANWGGAGVYPTQRHAWARLDDPNASAPYIEAQYITVQNTIDTSDNTFPAEQTAGPWWVADLTAGNATHKLCRYIAMADRLEVASWQFAAADYGETVVHFVNELLDETGGPRRYQLFLGAFPYTSPYDLETEAGRANEPTTALRDRVLLRMADDFEDTGIPDTDRTHVGTTAGAVRDLMRATVRAVAPELRSDVKWKPYDERADFRTWADANPTAAFRQFSIKTVGEIPPPVVSNTDVEWVETSVECVSAYPRDYRYGAQHHLSLDDVIESDLRQLEHAIGTNGYAALDQATGNEALVTTEATFREPGGAVVFGVLRLRVGFWRSMSA